MTSNETDTYFRKRGELSTFAASLRQAISDRDEEQKHEVRFYYDADVIVWLVLGFEFQPTGSNLRDRLVHALLSTGYLGRVHVLRPHALEFFTVLKRQPEFHSSRSNARFHERVRLYVRNRGVEQSIRGMAEAIRGVPDEHKLDILLRKFRESGAETFATIALTDGYWQTRLKRLHDPNYTIVRFDETETDMREEVAHDDVWKFYRVIAGARRVEKSINTLADATAMSLLSRAIARHAVDPAVPRVRFYTATESLLAVQSDPECAALLQYPHVAQEPESIFRSTTYYILRASFDALRFDSLKPREGEQSAESSAITLTELNDVAEQVARALEATTVEQTAELAAVRISQDDLMRRIEEIRVGDRDLPTVLEDIEQNAFLKRVLTDYDPPEGFRSILKDFAQVWDAFDTKTASVRLHDAIRSEAQQLANMLGQGVKELKQSFDFTRRVLDRVNAIVRDGKFPAVPDPMRDLGLVRWAAHLTDEARPVLEGFVQSLFVEGANPVNVTRACSDLVARAESPEDEAMCSAIAGLLWTLGLFRDVIDVINRYHDFCRESGNPELPAGLNIMRTAARLRANDSFSRNEKETHMDALEKLVETSSEECRGRLYIGLGYAAFYLWYIDQPLIGAQSEEDARWAKRWAERSLGYGERAIKLLTNDPIGLAFAVNHCAFTAMTTGIDHDDTAKFLNSLTNFRDNPNVWNYRFADTIATRYLSNARGFWTVARDMKPQSHERNTNESKACAALNRAEMILNESKPYFGDSEVHKTLLRVRTMQDEIGCPRADRSPIAALRERPSAAT